MNDQERHMQFIIREKLKGYSLPVTKCRSALLMDLAHEIKELKEELENGKTGKNKRRNLTITAKVCLAVSQCSFFFFDFVIFILEDSRGGDQLNISNSQSGDVSGAGHGRHHRPSLIGGLFSGMIWFLHQERSNGKVRQF